MAQLTPECILCTYNCELTFQETFSFIQLLFNRRESSFQRHCKGLSLAEESLWNRIRSLALFSQDCYFSHLRLSFFYQKHWITFCVHSSKQGCEICCYFLQFFPAEDGEADRSADAEVRNSGEYLRYKTALTKKTLVEAHWPRYTSQHWSENRMIKSS